MNLLNLMIIVALLEAVLILVPVYFFYRMKLRQLLAQRPEILYWGKMLYDMGLPQWNYSQALRLFRRMLQHPPEYWEDLFRLINYKLPERHHEMHQRLEAMDLQFRHLEQTNLAQTQQHQATVAQLHDLQTEHLALKDKFRKLSIARSYSSAVHDFPQSHYLPVRVQTSWLETRPVELLFGQLHEWVGTVGFQTDHEIPAKQGLGFRQVCYQSIADHSVSDFQNNLTEWQHYLESHDLASHPLQKVCQRFWQLYHSAVLQIGNVLMVRLAHAGETRAHHVFRLSASQMAQLEETPHLFQDPHQLIQLVQPQTP